MVDYTSADGAKQIQRMIGRHLQKCCAANIDGMSRALYIEPDKIRCALKMMVNLGQVRSIRPVQVKTRRPVAGMSETRRQDLEYFSLVKPEDDRFSRYQNFNPSVVEHRLFDLHQYERANAKLTFV